MELHASTQMSITGRYGAEYLKELGATRIVPARELSLSEIIKIKETVGIEIEAFVHGAMCYSYSGNCLFSSLLGGRSGNRGRCAQPCRLPYQVNAQPNEFKNTKYPLSLKDLCTLQDIPRLIQAGIDSFKIEGRMKKPEYAAGVTALYRKYIDSYLSESSAPFAVEREDMLRLSSLYLRSEISNGYYDRQNDRNMVTPDKPSYNGTDDALLLELKQKHMEEKLLVPVSARLVVKIDEPLLLTVSAFGTTVTVMEGKVLEAQKQPTTEADFQKQLSKTGGTNFFIKDVLIDLEPNSFVPIKIINEIRRKGLEQLEDVLITTDNIALRKQVMSNIIKTEETPNQSTSFLSASVLTIEQSEAVAKTTFFQRIYVDSTIYNDVISGLTKIPEVFCALPYIMREKDESFLNNLKSLLSNNRIDGFLVRNYEQLQWLKKINCKKEIILDSNMYCFNKSAKNYWKLQGYQITVPYELNEKELLQLGVEGLTIPCYGRIPMMITANCIKKTTQNCNHIQSIEWIKDRIQTDFPVLCNCAQCYNVIYNSVPLSLSKYVYKLVNRYHANIRLDFTLESSEEVFAIGQHFYDAMNNRKTSLPLVSENVTQGHYNKGVL